MTSAVEQLGSGDLITELAARAPSEGANVGAWRGLTVYRFPEPTEPLWEEPGSPSLCIVAQGRKEVVADGRRYVYDPSTYLVTSGHLRSGGRVLDASAEQPFLSLVLDIEPALVRRISAAMVQGPGGPHPPAAPAQCDDRFIVSTLDEELTGSVVRFLRAQSTATDRRVLAPLYQQEMVYRILQREQFARTVHFAVKQAGDSPVAPALAYIRDHLAEPLTVDLLAGQVNLSSSAFTRTFRESTGRSPYQFVKEMRMNRARELLIEGRLGVGEVSVAIGYASPSHFIREFRGRFGTTPGELAHGRFLRRRQQGPRRPDPSHVVEP